MNSLAELFRRFSWRQRITILTVVLGVAGGLYQLVRWNEERDFKPLFTGLAAEDAGAAVAKLKELGIDHRLKEDGSAILVPSSRVAEVRLQLASEGLPRTGRIGFELFDKTNFGASEFTEQVNYQRAVEGELERSVMSIREVELARVHITPAKDSLYSESRQSAKASVLVKLKRAGTLTSQNVAAIAQLAASAVPGLSADQVSVVDTSGTLLSRPRPHSGESEASEASLEYRKSVERDIQIKIAQTLEPLLGADHFRVGVSADVDLSSGEQSEESFDPQKSVMVSSQTSQDGPSLPAASGTPGTASNIPNPTANAARTSTGASNYARKTENVSYQTSRVVRHTKLPQGTVKKVSLSVLVDHTLRWEGEKRVVEPPTPEKLKVIRDLVTAATGLDTGRGDQLAVEAFPFEATLLAEPVTARPSAPAPVSTSLNLPPWLQKLVGQPNVLVLVGIGAASVVVLGAGFFLVGRRSRKKKIVAQAGGIEGGKAGSSATGEIQAKFAEHAAEHARKEAEALLSLKVGELSTKKTEVLTKHISEEVKNNPAGMAHVVRSWLNGEYQR